VPDGDGARATANREPAGWAHTDAAATLRCLPPVSLPGAVSIRVRRLYYRLPKVRAMASWRCQSGAVLM
jgi:hypothetical protein